VAFLQREIAFLARFFGYASYVVPYVLSYTIYGFLLTVGRTKGLQMPLWYPSEIDWTQLSSSVLIVATPFNRQLLIDSQHEMPIKCLGVSAAAPLYQGLYQSINAKEIKLTELYGATET
jgi:hypothetical protein